MLEQFKKMLGQAEMISGFKEELDFIEYDGETIEVVNIFVQTDVIGNGVKAVFHRGTETLIDLCPIHKCTCHK